MSSSTTGPRLAAEFTIEPFRDGDPGPHVLAAERAARELGLDVVVGPFGSSVAGDAELVLDAVRALAAAATAQGATRISVQITVRDA